MTQHAGERAERRVVRRARSDDLLSLLAVHARRDPGGQIPKVASEREQRTWARVINTPDLTTYIGELDGDRSGRQLS